MQIDAGKLQRSKGTGLGLTLCKSIVELHGGSVGFHSQLGVGSAFYFELPMQLCLLDTDRSSRSRCSGTRAGETPSIHSGPLGVASPSVPMRTLARHYSSPTSGPISEAADASNGHGPPDLAVGVSAHAAAGAAAAAMQSHLSTQSATSDGCASAMAELGGDVSVRRVPTEQLFTPTSPESAFVPSLPWPCSPDPPPLPVRGQSSQSSVCATDDLAQGHAQAQVSESASMQQQTPRTVKIIHTRYVRKGAVMPAATAAQQQQQQMQVLQLPKPTSAPVAASSDSSSSSALSPGSRPVRVLVVEDSAPNRKLLCALLTRLKCAATPAEHGQQCVDLLRPHFTAPAERAAAHAAATAKFAAGDAAAPVSPGPRAAQFVAVGAQAEQRPKPTQPTPPPLPFDIVLMVSHTAARPATRARPSPLGWRRLSCRSRLIVQWLTSQLFLCLFIFFSSPCRPLCAQDNSMPVMDGVTATQILRAGGLSLPVVGVTGNALEEDIQSFMAGGADEILVSSTASSDRDEKARAATAVPAGSPSLTSCPLFAAPRVLLPSVR
jgi:CheY-like chemotaxis protein